MTSQSNQVNLFFFNVDYSLLDAERRRQLRDYLSGMPKFVEFFLQERYNLDAKCNYYTPISMYGRITNWHDLANWHHQHITDFEVNALHVYVLYNQKIVVPSLLTGSEKSDNVVGYCYVVSEKKNWAGRDDFIYCHMPELHPISNDIYTWYEEFSKLLSHELEHFVLYKRNNSQWLKAVHAQRFKPAVSWIVDGKEKVYYSQPSPI